MSSQHPGESSLCQRDIVWKKRKWRRPSQSMNDRQDYQSGRVRTREGGPSQVLSSFAPLSVTSRTPSKEVPCHPRGWKYRTTAGTHAPRTVLRCGGTCWIGAAGAPWGGRDGFTLEAASEIVDGRGQEGGRTHGCHRETPWLEGKAAGRPPWGFSHWLLSFNQGPARAVVWIASQMPASEGPCHRRAWCRTTPARGAMNEPLQNGNSVGTDAHL